MCIGLVWVCICVSVYVHVCKDMSVHTKRLFPKHVDNNNSQKVTTALLVVLLLPFERKIVENFAKEFSPSHKYYNILVLLFLLFHSIYSSVDLFHSYT